ncbi:MAG: ribonuclease J [Fimbriimonas ginsengisoli]|uniref:Ribonuclease J n=1 Tax=Fimbriimonas ginsengisoli TaxID=1005039 RepID=A0A931LVY6_FIMGI|nr:ribonuclease J [Fimbriimonas ginsengisoli]
MTTVQIVPLGGVGEIGKNCTVVRQGDDIVVIDCGLSFPTEEMFGIDIVIPDFTYLVEHKDKIRGVFLTHAHEDHVGSLPYLLRQIRVPVFASEFTHALIRNKLEEKLPIKELDLRTFEAGDILQAGSLSVEPIRVTHSIPESCSMAVRTEHGIVLFTGDFKFDFTPVDNKLTNITRFGELAREGVVLLLSDSTNVDRPGWGPSERAVADGLKQTMNDAEGRVLLTTFASNIHRIQQFFTAAAETGRKVAVVGRRMEQNLEICSRLGYLIVPKSTLVKLDEMSLYSDSKLAILTTGSQGEPMSALVQMSKGEYGRLQIKEGDTLLYSARPIPGNEAAIWRTINRLFKQGCKVIYDAPTPIHVSGHAYQEELKMMINLTRPFYVAPVHGEPRHQHVYNQMALEMGYPEHRLFTLTDGVPLCLEETKAYLGEQEPCGRVLVDSSGTPGVTDEVLRDRSNVARDGILVVTVAIDPEKGELVGDPVVQAKGVHGPDGLSDLVFEALVEALDGLSREELSDLGRVRHEAADVVRRFVQKKASLRPLVLVSVLEI